MYGFDRHFFEGGFPLIFSEYGSQRDLRPDAVTQRVTLRNGAIFEIEGGRWSDEWIAFFVAGEDRIVFAPFSEMNSAGITQR